MRFTLATLGIALCHFAAVIAIAAYSFGECWRVRPEPPICETLSSTSFVLLLPLSLVPTGPIDLSLFLIATFSCSLIWGGVAVSALSLLKGSHRGTAV